MLRDDDAPCLRSRLSRDLRRRRYVDVPDGLRIRTRLCRRGSPGAHCARARRSLCERPQGRIRAAMTHVFFVILPDVVLLDVAGAAEAFRIAEQQRAGSYELTFVSPARTVRSG